uniref:Tyrosine-specific transport protein isoform X2 n=1 Tax=Rhizophora mucronata TaxID=61149 RepID=A0A2P2M7U3_RHIMU
MKASWSKPTKAEPLLVLVAAAMLNKWSSFTGLILIR